MTRRLQELWVLLTPKGRFSLDKTGTANFSSRHLWTTKHPDLFSLDLGLVGNNTTNGLKLTRKLPADVRKLTHIIMFMGQYLYGVKTSQASEEFDRIP